MKYCGIYADAGGDVRDALASLGSLKDGEFIGVKNLQALAGKTLADFFQVRDLAPAISAPKAAS